MNKNHEPNHNPDWIPIPDSDDRQRISEDTWQMILLLVALSVIGWWIAGWPR